MNTPFTLKFTSASTFTLETEDKLFNGEKSYVFNERIEGQYYDFVIESREGFLPSEYINERFVFIINSFSHLVNKYRWNTTFSIDHSSGIIEIGTNGTNTVLFRSQSNDSSKVTLTHTPNSSSDNSLVFNGCDYVTFKHMKIRAVGAQYATPVRFNSSAYNNALRNCIIEGASTNSSSSNMAVIYSSGGSNNTEISHCIINNGSQGLYFSSSSNINIEYNQFNNQYYYKRS